MKTYICENCSKEHDGSYGSGRFCSKSCRMSFISKQSVNKHVPHKNKRSNVGTWKCRFCNNIIFNTKHELYEHYHLVHKDELKRKSWNKGKTKETDIRLKTAAKTLHDKYKSGELVPSFFGKHHTDETRKKQSKSALASKHQRICKRTEPYKCVDGSIVNLDSSYERTVAKLLDEHKIKWNRPKPLIWIDKKNVQHHYFPDFYLVDYDVYLDPKNEYCFKVQKEKIDYVKEHYSNCFFLTEKQLNWKYINSLLFS